MLKSLETFPKIIVKRILSAILKSIFSIKSVFEEK